MNTIVVLMEIGAIISDFVTHAEGVFVYYTNDSNYFACVVCLVAALFEIRALRMPVSQIPYPVKVLKYIATCCLTLTFTVVLTILVPAWSSTGANGFKMMFGPYQMFARHLACPLLAFISFVFFETEPVFSKKTILFGEIPTLLYAAVTVVLNALRIIDGPYPFLRIHNQSVLMSFVWGFLVIGISLLLSWIIWLCNRRKQQ